MKSSIKKFVEKNQKLHYLALCLTRFNDDKFRDRVEKIGKELNMVEVKKGAGTEKNGIYLIEVGSSTIGFFALLRIVLNGVAFADYYGLKPLVLYKDCVSYKEDETVNGSDNPFEYYFEQTTDINIGVHEFLNSQAGYLSCMESHYSRIFDLYNLKDIEGYLLEKEHYVFYANVVKKYLQYNDTIKAKLTKDISSIKQSKKMIGVHYRGTDFKNNYGSHPVSIGVEEYINAIKMLPQKYQSYDIFLATDDEVALEEIINEFGSRVHYFNDVKRSDGKLSVICSEDKRPLHKYLLGYEVIRDVEMLAQMDVLVAGLSQVATFARIFKLSKDSNYDYDMLMNKGVNHNKRSHTTDMNKARQKR